MLDVPLPSQDQPVSRWKLSPFWVHGVEDLIFWSKQVFRVCGFRRSGFRLQFLYDLCLGSVLRDRRTFGYRV